MDSSPLNRRIEAIEQVVQYAPAVVAMEAVDYLIAIPDERERLRSFLRLSDIPTLEQPVVDKIKAYLSDYDTFVKEARERYPTVHKDISPDLLFDLRYHEFRKTGDLAVMDDLIEHLDTGSQAYQQALLVRYLTIDDTPLPELLTCIHNLQPFRLAESLALQDHTVPRDWNTFAAIIEKLVTISTLDTAVVYAQTALSLFPEQKGDLFTLLASHHLHISSNKEGKALLETLTGEIYRVMQQEKTVPQRVMSFLKHLFPFVPGKAVEIATELAMSKQTFQEVYDLGEMVLKHNPERAITLFHQALQLEGNYPNTVKVATRLLEASRHKEAEVYFREAAEKNAGPEEYEATADYLFGQKKPLTAGLFYEKMLGEERDMRKAREIGEKYVNANELVRSKKFFDMAAEKASSFDEHIRCYGAYIKHAQDEMDICPILMQTLQKYPSLESISSAAEIVARKYGARKAEEFTRRLRVTGGQSEAFCDALLAYETEHAQQGRRVDPFVPPVLRPSVAKLAPPQEDYIDTLLAQSHDAPATDTPAKPRAYQDDDALEQLLAVVLKKKQDTEDSELLDELLKNKT